MQVSLKTLDPPIPIITSSLPDESLLPDHEPDAEQDEAEEEDHVSVTGEFTSAESEDEDSETLMVVPLDIGLSDEPPPPPPQEEIPISINNRKENLCFFKDTNKMSKKITYE